jgi:hypothetical protein
MVAITDTADEQDFRDQILADDLTQVPGAYVREQRQQHEERLEAAEILEGLRALDSGGDGVRWAIARVGDPDPAKNGHLVTWATVQLEADQIRDAFGGGKYYVKGRRSNGDYAGHKTLTIAGDAPRRENATVIVAPGGAVNGTHSLNDFLSAQERRDRERQEREDKRAADRERLILAALPAAATVLAAMFSRPQVDIAGLAAALKPAPAPAPTDPIAMLAALKQLVPEQPKGPGPMEQALTLFELLADKAGAGQGRTEWLDVVKEGVKMFGPSVGGAIEATITQARERSLRDGNSQQTPPNGQGQPGVNGSAPLQGAHPSQALPAPQAGPAGGSFPEGDPAMLELLDLAPHVPWLREQLTKLSNAAQRGRDPALYAAMFLEELPEGLTAHRVHQLLIRSDWHVLLARFNPQIAQQQAWWIKTRAAIVAYIEEATAPKPPKEIERPTALPSLTGE